MVPVHISLRGGILRFLTTRTVVFGSVLTIPGVDGDLALQLLLQEYIYRSAKRSLFTELRNVSDLEEKQPLLLKLGFSYEKHLNYLINLKTSPDQIFQEIGARTRKNIRRGLNKGDVLIREATEPEQLSACYDLLRQTYQLARVPLADRSLFTSAFELLYPQKMIRFTLAYVGDVPVAVSIDLLYKDVIYGWYGGMDRSYSRYVPNEILMWSLLKWGSENGFSTYDFGGAGNPDEEYGVRNFKAKFGGKLVCYGRNTYVNVPPILWASKQGYQILRHIFNGSFLKAVK
jgi:serine/alanine adding enzyme